MHGVPTPSTPTAAMIHDMRETLIFLRYNAYLRLKDANVKARRCLLRVSNISAYYTLQLAERERDEDVPPNGGASVDCRFQELAAECLLSAHAYLHARRRARLHTLLDERRGAVKRADDCRFKEQRRHGRAHYLMMRR